MAIVVLVAVLVLLVALIVGVVLFVRRVMGRAQLMRAEAERLQAIVEQRRAQGGD